MGFYPFAPLPVGPAQISVPLDLTATGTSPVFGAATTGDTFNRVELDADGRIRFGPGSGATDAQLLRVGVNQLKTAGPLQVTGTLDVLNAGNGLAVAEGSNAKQGTFTLTGVTSQAVPNTSVTANSRIFLCEQVAGGTPGLIGVASRIPGTSFTVSCVATDTSTYAYEIFEPG